MSLNNNIKIFSGSSNPELTAKICKYLGVSVGCAKIEKFPDGEKIIKCADDVRGKDCFVVQSGSDPVDANLVEMLIFLDCLKRASAERVTAVIPYFGYARQDRKDEGRVPITAKLVSNLITTAGADRVLAMDLHAAQLQGFFDIPVDHLFAEPVLTKYFQDKKIDNLTIVSPDVGNIKRAARYVAHLNGELAIIHKRRINSREVQCGEIIGAVKDRNILMCDDMITTAGTICTAAKLVKERGAKKVFVGATHGLFCDKAVENIAGSPIDEVVVTDTVPLKPNVKKLANLKVLSVSDILGEAIKRIHKNESVSALFS
ncbi:MAG: ribose-phosphate pyrophosphokinase [Planctomycetes bacterium]|nr:ribose-phosphate pyrophosphokinase [Planctomycetota bacterium]MBU1518026.1 ribose-phosphate pyrophosphokinase [Planctomycetota bacterium]MBU2458216.1 ribose-phosphate pyrophosphokinase [Planctomycetota bacterium]MBU2596863.1 ribose-phosphate pyrophosphokinase [Planctomycetota bacterium]